LREASAIDNITSIVFVKSENISTENKFYYKNLGGKND